MKPIVREHFETELRKAQFAIAAGEIETAWTALQRAHILGQAYPIPHAIAHWNMLKLAWRQRDLMEVAAQLIPTIVAIPLTMLVGQQRSLRGGKANVPDPKQREIPNDLLKILNQ